jgi:hypothetical protein
MRQIPGTERNGELIESLKQFLNAQSEAQPATLYCRECGSLLRYLPAQFWLEGAEHGWNIRCPTAPIVTPCRLQRKRLSPESAAKARRTPGN